MSVFRNLGYDRTIGMYDTPKYIAERTEIYPETLAAQLYQLHD